MMDEGPCGPGVNEGGVDRDPSGEDAIRRRTQKTPAAITQQAVGGESVTRLTEHC